MEEEEQHGNVVAFIPEDYWNWREFHVLQNKWTGVSKNNVQPNDNKYIIMHASQAMVDVVNWLVPPSKRPLKSIAN